MLQVNVMLKITVEISSWYRYQSFNRFSAAQYFIYGYNLDPATKSCPISQ